MPIVERLAGRGERHGAHTFGEPASWRSGASAQITSSSVTQLDRAAAGSSGVAARGGGVGRRARRRRTARRACGRRARGGRCPQPAMSIGAVRGELRGVDEQLGAVRVGELRQLGDRPHLAGDVRGAGHGDQVDPRPCRAARARTRSSSSSAEVGERAAAAGRGGATGACWRGARPAWRARRAPAGSAVASTLIASVVLRTKTTLSSARADELGDGLARVLERRGRDLRLGAAAAVHAAVPGHERLDGVPHGGHHGRAGRVVEVHVAPRAPVGARHHRVGADQPGGRLAHDRRASARTTLE